MNTPTDKTAIEVARTAISLFQIIEARSGDELYREHMPIWRKMIKEAEKMIAGRAKLVEAETGISPCPFCGTNPEWFGESIPDGHYALRCPNCRVMIREDRRDKAIGIWNTRVDSLEQPKDRPKQEPVIGHFYRIDEGFNNSGKVKLISFGDHFCQVEDPESGEKWMTMVYRLSEWKEPHTDSADRERLLDWLLERKASYKDKVLKDEFINGRFWEVHDVMQFLQANMPPHT